MQNPSCIQTGCHTIALLLPYSAEWRVPGVRRRERDNRLYTCGKMFAAELISVNCGKYKKLYWKLTIHASRPHQLLSAKALLRRVKTVLAALHAPAYLVHNILTGNIPLCRVDLAQDYRADGVIQPTAEDRKEYNIKRMTDTRTVFTTLYIQTEKRTVVECRYDKSKELYEVYNILPTKPISRIERRFHGSRACTRHAVRTIPALCYYLRRMRAASRARVAVPSQGATCRRPSPYSITPHPPLLLPQPFPQAARRTPEGGARLSPLIKKYFFIRGPPRRTPRRTKNPIAHPAQR